ncbi:hypothetical protein BJX64DRAFT_294323 [Aspergillus heterothallicus]
MLLLLAIVIMHSMANTSVTIEILIDGLLVLRNLTGTCWQKTHWPASLPEMCTEHTERTRMLCHSISLPILKEWSTHPSAAANDSAGSEQGVAHKVGRGIPKGA